MDRLCNLPFMIISYVALVVLLTLSFLAFEKLPVLEIKIPRNEFDYLTTHTSLPPIRHGFAPGFVNYKKVHSTRK
jgi:hypothetical protein